MRLPRRLPGGPPAPRRGGVGGGKPQERRAVRPGVRAEGKVQVLVIRHGVGRQLLLEDKV